MSNIELRKPKGEILLWGAKALASFCRKTPAGPVLVPDPDLDVDLDQDPGGNTEFPIGGYPLRSPYPCR